MSKIEEQKMAKIREGDRRVEEWNKAHKVGIAVNVRRDDGTILETVTRSEAWATKDGSPIVSVRGISGGYLLDRVTPRTGG